MGKHSPTLESPGARNTSTTILIMSRGPDQEVDDAQHVWTMTEATGLSNSEEDQFVCRFCEKPLYSARSLQIHEARHTEQLKYLCSFCDKTFPSEAVLARHERTHTGENELLCPLCDCASFREKRALVNHITKMHPMHVTNCELSEAALVAAKVEELEEEEEDSKAFIDSIIMKQTEQTNSRSVMATIINTSTAASAVLTTSSSSQQQQQQQIRNFPVTSCKSENYVSTTTRSEGSKEARFQCGYCDKSFATPSKVKRHILTHTGEKPFVCQFCQRGFSQKVHMMEHISKHHADESLKAQQEAAAVAAAAAAAAQAAGPAPLIKTLPSTKTLYATQTIATSAILHSSQQHQSSQQQQLVRLTHVPVTAGQTTTITTASHQPVFHQQLHQQQHHHQEMHQVSQQHLLQHQHHQVCADTTADGEDDNTVQIPIPENSYIVAEFSIKSESSMSPHEDDDDEVDTTDSLMDTKADILAIPLSSHSLMEYADSDVTTDSQTFSLGGGQQQQSSVGFGTVSQSGDRPFICSHCNADFIRQSNLSVHMMKVHGEVVEVRSHQCGYCDKRFKYPNKKRLHEMTHTGEKPNVCQFCTMGFFKKSRLRAHLAKQHGISEEELNSNSAYLQSPTSTVLISQGTVLQQHKSEDSLMNGGGSDEDLYCQYCQKPFGNRTDLLLHERQEAMEFEQLHEMFEDSEFSGLVEVTASGAVVTHGGASQTDIIQNALLNAGIENGLGSPNGVVTDSDSVVTISEADIDSFSIGFIPDASWTNEVSTNLTSSSSLVTTTMSGGDHYHHHPQLQPLDLNISHGGGGSSGGDDNDEDDDDDGSSSRIHVTTASQADLQAALQAGTTIYTTSSDTFANIKTEPISSLGDMNQMWETTVALSGVPTSLSSIIKSEPSIFTTSMESISSSSSSSGTLTMQGELFTTSANGLNGIYTETFTIPSGLGAGGQEGAPLNAQIISIAGQTATIINGTEIDFSKLTAAGGTFTISAQQLLDQDTLTFQVNQVSSYIF